MKHRLAKQIEEINQFLGIFRSSKSKCGRFLAKLDLDMQQIQEYDKIEKLFKIDLNILDLNHLRDRKSKLVKAIDQLTKLQSELNLKIIKQAEKEQAEFEQFSQRQIDDSLVVEENDDKQSEPQILTHIDALKINTNENRRISHKRRSAECEVKTSRCGQLYNIWSKNRPEPNQNVQDKFDRLSKIIGILKKNAKEIYEQEKQRNDNLILQDSDEYNEIKQELYNLKQQNINLKNINTQLSEQNTTLKQSTKLQTKEQSINKGVFETKDTQTDTESEQNLMVSENFSRIINIYNPETEYSIDGSRLYKKHDELQCQSIIKSSELGDSIIQDFSNRRLRTNSEQDPAESSLEQSTFGILTFNKRVMNQNEVTKQAGVKQLQGVENKLKEIKQNRKRISNDDDLWSQMENMQL